MNPQQPTPANSDPHEAEPLSLRTSRATLTHTRDPKSLHLHRTCAHENSHRSRSRLHRSEFHARSRGVTQILTERCPDNESPMWRQTVSTNRRSPLRIRHQRGRLCTVRRLPSPAVDGSPVRTATAVDYRFSSTNNREQFSREDRELIRSVLGRARHVTYPHCTTISLVPLCH